jgi:hypothetical protein
LKVWREGKREFCGGEMRALWSGKYIEVWKNISNFLKEKFFKE